MSTQTFEAKCGDEAGCGYWTRAGTQKGAEQKLQRHFARAHRQRFHFLGFTFTPPWGNVFPSTEQRKPHWVNGK
jgi:hypothetical protein